MRLPAILTNCIFIVTVASAISLVQTNRREARQTPTAVASDVGSLPLGSGGPPPPPDVNPPAVLGAPSIVGGNNSTDTAQVLGVVGPGFFPFLAPKPPPQSRRQRRKQRRAQRKLRRAGRRLGRAHNRYIDALRRTWG